MASGATRVWIKYALPSYYIQERRGVTQRYEIRLPEIADWQVGMVERYFTASGTQRWRTLDHWKCDWRDNFASREEAAQDLVSSCPRTISLIQTRRQRLEEKRTAPENSQKIP